MVLLNKQSFDAVGGSNESAHVGFMVGNKFCFFTSFGQSTWVVDSGASDHITPNLSLFLDVKPIHQYCCITMPNGKQALSKHVGSVQIALDLILKDMLHVPDFQFNMLSVSKLTTKWCYGDILT